VRDFSGPAAAIAIALTLSACEQPQSSLGDPKVGGALIGEAQCGACHAIPGIAAADGMSGPPLKAFSRRTIIAGILANTPSNLAAWIRSPQTISPGNAMPNMNLSDSQARDIAAYLDTLQ
jgi:cytochrome c1